MILNKDYYSAEQRPELLPVTGRGMPLVGCIVFAAAQFFNSG